MRKKKPEASSFSRRQRRDGGDAERRIWGALRDRRLGGFKFVRQEPVGRYTVDFCCRERKLIVEIDGSQHIDSTRDRVRDAWLVAHGYRVLRFWNNDALAETEGVATAILAELEALPSTPGAPSP
jgi:very-short-patch-repair endonuclease